MEIGPLGWVVGGEGWKIGPLCGIMGKIDRQQMGPLYCSKRFQDTIQVNSSAIVSSDKIELIFFSRKGQWKGYKIGNSQLLFPPIPCTKKEWKVTSSNRSFFTEPIY